MKHIILPAVCLALCGCNTITFTETRPDGSKIEARCLRAFWASENYEAELDGKAKLKASRSKTDAEALGAVAEGFARGAK